MTNRANLVFSFNVLLYNIDMQIKTIFAIFYLVWRWLIWIKGSSGVGIFPYERESTLPSGKVFYQAVTFSTITLKKSHICCEKSYYVNKSSVMWENHDYCREVSLWCDYCIFSVQVNLPCSDGNYLIVPIRKKLVTYIIMKIDFFNCLRI